MTTLSIFGISAPFSSPFFTGESAQSDEIPGRFPVGINGRGFMLDLASNQYIHQSVPLLRPQADQSDRPDEGSVNPDDLWRRTATSWHLGAGQRDLDHPVTSAPGRFWSSKGIDPWTLGELKLLPTVGEKVTSTNTNLGLAVAGSYLYLLDGADISYTQDITPGTPTWTDITGESATAGTAITSDGYTIYTAHAADGVYVTTRGGASTAKGVTGTVTGLKYLKGRLFGWAADVLYNITTIDTGSPSALPSALLDHPNSDFTWVDVAEAAGFYFPAGYSGDRSTIYRTAVEADGTGLDTPVVAAELPDGEIVRSIYGYLGFLVIGTDKGIRFGVPSAAGDITLGALITDATEVRCFEGQESFVWFGWSQYDATSTGLGRMDLGSFNGSKPAYASDLMATENGDVLSVVTFQGIRVFAVSGDGIFAEHANLVDTGTIDLGRITYGLHDTKVSMFLNVAHKPLVGTITASMARDHASTHTTLGAESSTAGSVRSNFSTNRARAQAFDVRLVLTGEDTEGPEITLVTLRAYPSAKRTERITLPLLLGTDQKDANGYLIGRSTIDDTEFLLALESEGAPVLLQEGTSTAVAVLEDHEWRPHHYEPNSGQFAGTFLAQFKRFSTE